MCPWGLGDKSLPVLPTHRVGAGAVLSRGLALSHMWYMCEFTRSPQFSGAVSTRGERLPVRQSEHRPALSLQ